VMNTSDAYLGVLLWQYVFSRTVFGNDGDCCVFRGLLRYKERDGGGCRSACDDTSGWLKGMTYVNCDVSEAGLQMS